VFELPEVDPFFPNFKPDVKSMSEDERYFFLLNLEHHTKKMKIAFASLMVRLQKEVKSINDVIGCLELIQDKTLAAAFKKHETMRDLFSQISKHISFFDYELVKFLIRNLGSHNLKKKLEKYKKMFNEYCKRRVIECPDDAFGDVHESEKLIKLKTDKDMEKLTVEELKKLQYQISSVLGQRVLRLLRVEEGCVQLTFRMTCEEFTLNSKQQQDLRNVGVSSITYGEQFMDFGRIQKDTQYG
jgi:hypothetical protein